MDTTWLIFGAGAAIMLLGVVLGGRVLLRWERDQRRILEREPEYAMPELERGTVLVLHGPPGCGKTLLGQALMQLHGGGARIQPADLCERALAGVFAGKHVPVLMVDDIQKWTPSIIEVLKQLASAPAISYSVGPGVAPVVNRPLIIACAPDVPPLGLMTGPLRRFRFHRADYRPHFRDHSMGDTQKRRVH